MEQGHVLRLYFDEQAVWDALCGMTSDLLKRVWEHKNKVVAGFTKRYGLNRLVWFEVHDKAEAAVRREKQIKEWKREWKINLLESGNPQWLDLSDAF